jgi:Mrp family chromosome partitioning ATPase
MLPITVSSNAAGSKSTRRQAQAVGSARRPLFAARHWSVVVVASLMGSGIALEVVRISRSEAARPQWIAVGLLLGLLVGLLVGLLGALRSASRPRGRQDPAARVAAELRAPVLAIVPITDESAPAADGAPEALLEPDDPTTDAFHRACSALSFVMQQQDEAVGSLLVTAAGRSHDASTIAANLAAAFTATGCNAAVVDDDVSPEAPISQTITEAEEGADLAVVHGPPIVESSEAQSIAGEVDGVVLVVGLEQTSVPELREAAAAVARSGARLLGVMVTSAEPSRAFGRPSLFPGPGERNASPFSNEPVAEVKPEPVEELAVQEPDNDLSAWGRVRQQPVEPVS